MPTKLTEWFRESIKPYLAIFKQSIVGVVKVTEVNVYEKAQRSKVDTVTYSASVTPDANALSNSIKIVLTGNLTLGKFTNIGNNEVQGGRIILEQDSTGGHTVDLSAWDDIEGDNTPDTSANKIAIYDYEVINGIHSIYHRKDA